MKYNFKERQFTGACKCLRRNSERRGLRYQRLSSDAREAVKEYHWPTPLDQDYQLVKDAAANSAAWRRLRYPPTQ